MVDDAEGITAISGDIAFPKQEHPEGDASECDPSRDQFSKQTFIPRVFASLELRPMAVKPLVSALEKVF